MSRAKRDFVLAAGAGLVILVLAGVFDFYEMWLDWSLAHENWDVDEVPMAMALASAAFAWFAHRRWREQAHEVRQRVRINDQLRTQIAAR